MATYINLTKMPLSITPSVGDSFIIPPKASATLTPEQESSPNLVTLLNKKKLKRLPELDETVFVAEEVLPEPVEIKVSVEEPKETEKLAKKVVEKALIEKTGKKPL